MIKGIALSNCVIKVGLYTQYFTQHRYDKMFPSFTQSAVVEKKILNIKI